MPDSPKFNWPFSVVSRYEGFVELAVSIGLVPPGTQAFSKCTGEDIRGTHVISDDLPIALAPYAAAVTILPISLPPELDVQTAPVALLRKFVGEAKTYWVNGSSEVVGEIYNGGNTPVGVEIGREIASLIKSGELSNEALGAAVDRLLWPERHAGQQTERLLLQILACERDRRLQLEDEVLFRNPPVLTSIQEANVVSAAKPPSSLP